MENKKTGFFSKVDNFFEVTKSGSTIKTEIVAGLVTFLAMAYILTVNPNQFFYNGTANSLWSSVFMATAFGAIIGTLLMAFLARLPLAQASGMGLNAMVGTIIGGGVGAFSTYVFEFTLANAMFMVFISGLIFFALSVISIKGKSLRQYIFDGIPTSIKVAIPAGIGLFIAYIGLQNAGIIVTNGYTQVGLIDFTNWGEQITQWASGATTTPKTAVVCLIGLFTIVILQHMKIKGAVIFGILFATVIGIPLGVTDVSIVTGSTDGITWKFWENYANFFSCGDNSVLGIMFKGGWNFPAGCAFTVIMIIISFSMIDMFDTMGTCLGCCTEAGLLDSNGIPIRYNRIMWSDSIATCTGALFGTSTVTTFVESGAGVAAGGKTGLTALTTAILFLLATLLLPVFAMIPSAAAASALVYVGAIMLKNVKNINFDSIRVTVPAFLTVIIMPLGYSITKGIGVGILSFVIISAISYLFDLIAYKCGKRAEKAQWRISWFTLIVAALFAVYFFVPVV